MVLYLKDRNVNELYTITNGTLINEDMANFLIETQFTNLKISIDGAFEKTFDDIRGKGTYKRVEKSIKVLLERKKAKQSIYPKIIFTFVVMEKNYMEMPDLIHLAKEWGADKVEVHHCQMQNDDLNEMSMYDRKNEYNIALRHAIKASKQLDIEFEFPPAFEFPGKEQSNDNELKGFDFCRDPWEFFFIDQKGNVYPCCHLWGVEFGNVYQDSLEEIWNGEMFTRVRHEINSHGIAECCMKSACPKVERYSKGDCK